VVKLKCGQRKWKLIKGEDKMGADGGERQFKYYLPVLGGVLQLSE